MSRHSGISLFLMELVIMLAVFVTVAAIDTLMLVKANNLSRQSENLDRAVEYAVSAAECYRATGGGALAGMTATGGAWTQYFDKNWQSTDESGAKFAVIMTDTGGGAQVTVNDGGESIYTLSVKAAPNEG
jgi:hypothetical protein